MNKHNKIRLTPELLSGEEVIEELNESTNLTEAFSPSMPEWLKGALESLSILNYEDSHGRMQDADERRKRKNHISSKYGNTYRSITGGALIMRLIKEKGIDISKAMFIEGDIPQNARDPRLKDPYLPIFLIKDGNERRVYAKGVNDEEHTPSASYGNSFKYMSTKELLNLAIAFCYVDTSDPENLIGSKIDDRAAMKKELHSLNYYRQPASRIGASVRIDNILYDVDKSGYVVNPLKYVNMAKNMHRNDLASYVEKYHKKLSNLKEQILKVLSSDVKDWGNYRKEANRFVSSPIIDYLSNACNTYNQICMQIDELEDYTDEEKKQKAIDSILGVSHSISSGFYTFSELDRKIDKIENEIKKNASARINWSESLNEDRDFKASDIGAEKADRANTTGGKIRRELMKAVVADYPVANQAGVGGNYEDIKNAKLLFDVNALTSEKPRNGAERLRTWKDVQNMIIDRLTKIGVNLNDIRDGDIEVKAIYNRSGEPQIRVRIKDNIHKK